MDSEKIKERRRQKAADRSRLAAPKKKVRSERSLDRLQKFKIKQILWRKFEV